MPTLRVLPLALMSLFVFLPAFAQSTVSDSLPESLKEWVPWVQDPSTQCVRGALGFECNYTPSLSLVLDDEGGTFTLTATLYQDGYLTLPGGPARWPVTVREGKTRVSVVAQKGVPKARLKKGTHTLNGRFRWSALPESLAIPDAVGVLGLKVRGKEVPQKGRAHLKKIFLEKRFDNEAVEKNRMEIRVHRKLEDGVPLRLTTQIDLDVSGEAREEKLGPPLPEGFTLVSLEGSLPVSLTQERLLSVQVRPGQHTLTLVAIGHQDVKSIAFGGESAEGQSDAQWSEDEVWVIQSNPALRALRTEAESVDPSRTQLPAAWRSLPSYRLSKDRSMTLVTERRGDESTGGDQLTLDRTLWLDFDGRGFTVEDKISGTLNSGWRLEANDSLKLGRVASEGDNLFITRTENKRSGVELRSDELSVSAESRMEFQESLDAIGWAHDFHSVSQSLNLPKGWRLFHASGVDKVSASWVQQWDPLKFFIVLLLPIFFWRFYGGFWALVAGVTIVLVLPESPASIWAMVPVLVGEALLRVLPPGKLSTLIRIIRTASLIGITIGIVAFAHQHVQRGLYPSLDAKSSSSLSFAQESVSSIRDASPRGGSSGYAKKAGAMKQKKMRVYDPKAQLQTGTGLPRWTPSSSRLTFSGPVTQNQKMKLYLLSPNTNMALSFVRVFFLGLTLLCLLGLPGTLWPAFLRRKHQAWTLFAFPIFFAGFATPGNAETKNAKEEAAIPVPSKLDLLEDLKNRVNAPPRCGDTCVDVESMRLSVQENELELQAWVHVVEGRHEVALPGSAKTWLPESVRINNKTPALRLNASGVLHVALDAGVHQITMKGRILGSSVALPLGAVPHRVSAKDHKGWSVDGISREGKPEDTLLLTRIKRTSQAEASQTMAAFVKVERSLSLDLSWTMVTTVSRLSPLGVAVLMEVPLLSNEQVISEGVRVEDTKALVNLSANQESVTWRSTLPRFPKLELQAAKDVFYAEVWKVRAAAMWHLEAKGIAPLHGGESGVKEWHPWPGERVSLVVEKPEGVGGQTLTIDESRLSVEPGQRATDMTLALQLRSSRGDHHTVTLPKGAKLTGFSIDGKKQPPRQDGESVKIPLVPGKQSVVLSWRLNQHIETFTQIPQVDLGAPSVNSHVEVMPGGDRWVLFVKGPQMGPAVLLWGLLLILLAVAALLSREKDGLPSLWGWLLLGLGLSQLHVVAAAFVAGWLLIFAWRKRSNDMGVYAFNFRQLLIAGWTMIALGILVYAVGKGLLGSPEMQIRGNGSSSRILKWTLDRSEGMTADVGFFSLPSYAFRAAMLLWSLWLSFSLVRWLKRGWQIFSEETLWRRGPKKEKGAQSTEKSKAEPASSAPIAALSLKPTSRPSSNPLPQSADENKPTKVAGEVVDDNDDDDEKVGEENDSDDP